MRRTILAVLGVFKKRHRKDDREIARDEAEKAMIDGKRDMMLEAQRRDATR